MMDGRRRNPVLLPLLFSCDIVVVVVCWVAQPVHHCCCLLTPSHANIHYPPFFLTYSFSLPLIRKDCCGQSAPAKLVYCRVVMYCMLLLVTSYIGDRSHHRPNVPYLIVLLCCCVVMYYELYMCDRPIVFAVSYTNNVHIYYCINKEHNYVELNFFSM